MTDQAERPPEHRGEPRTGDSPLRRALSRPGFRRLFAAQTISRWGDTFNSVALVIVVYQLTGSGVKVAGTVAFEIVPVVVLGFVAGAIVDRHPRRQVMVVADLGRAAVALSLVVLHTQLTAVYLAAFLLSGFSVFFTPAAASVLPSLVDDDELVGANSAVWSAAVISQIALAPLAGALVAFAGPGPAFAINAATFLVSAALIRRLPVPIRPPSPPTKHLADIVEGLRTIRTSRFLSTLAGVQGLAALSAGATSALLVVLAQEHLRVGASHFGFLIAAIGVGAGFGPLLLQRLVNDVRRPSFLYGPYLVRGLVDLVLAATRSFGVALGALAFYGVGTSTGNITYNSVLQKTVPDRLRGRVFAFYDVVWQTARLASIGVGGLLADTFGIVTVYWAGGILLIIAGALGLTTETILTETSEVTDDQRAVAHGQQLTTAGVENDPAKLMEFLRWQVLRAAGPLREIVHRPETGPIPLAAAHAAEALQQLLGVIATGQGPTTADAEALPRDLRGARESLVNAVENVDILLRMVDFAADLAGEAR